MHKRLCRCLALVVLLVPIGCYDSQPLKEAAIVMGTGIDKAERDGYTFHVEILRVGAGGGSAYGEVGEQGTKRSLVLRVSADNLFEAARDLIDYSKRLLVFTHNRVWVISEKAAKENILQPFDFVMRDQMMRLNSFLFVSKDPPERILTTSTLLESLNSLELTVGMEALRYAGNLGQIYLMDFFESLSGPVKASFVPMIGLERQTENPVTVIRGVAVVKKDKMVGTLNQAETFGLMLLRGEVRTGWLKAGEEGADGRIVIEIQSQKSKVKTRLANGRLTADIEIKLRGTVANTPADIDWLDPGTIRKFESKMDALAQAYVEAALEKLQKEYRADVTNIGLQAYRKFPKEFNKVKDNWDEVFANAKISVRTHTDIYHPGLINESQGSIEHKPEKNPYKHWFGGK
jgi:spore germination protein KC